MDEAIDLLDELVGLPTFVSLPSLQTVPFWQPVREHPRFQELVDKYG